MRKIVVLLVTVAIAMTCFASCGKEESLDWEYITHTEVLPKPQSNKIDVHDNDGDGLWLTVEKMSANDYFEYKTLCKNDYGFNIDMEDDGNFFEGFNQEGYYVDLYYSESQEELSISLEVPMQMETYALPDYAIYAGLPVPKSEIGYYEWNDSDGFYVFVGNTTFAEYKEYKAECAVAGFNVNYEEDDDTYYAENVNGYTLHLSYEGFNRMVIELECPEELVGDDKGVEDTTEEFEEENKEAEEIEETEETQEETKDSAEDEQKNLVDGMRPEFKEAIDSYEEFFKEYCKFMEKYAEDPTDLGLLADYAKFTKQYAETMEAMEKWEDSEMNAAETLYYAEVMGRITKMLASVSV